MRIRSMLNWRIFLSFVAAAAVIAPSHQGHAGANTSTTGASCMPIQTNYSRGVTSIANNSSSAPLTVICPLTRAFAGGLGNISIVARAARSATDTTNIITCNGYRFDVLNNLVSVSTTQTWSQAGATSLSFGFTGGANPFDSVSLLCGLTKVNDALLNISMSEM